MSNIFHEIKRGFLVLGFTGPLSSGCTTAARFFERDINEYIKKRCAKALPKIEFAIKRRYKELQSLKKDLNNKDELKSKIYSDIKRISFQIREKLYLRETLTVLREYQDNNYKYISMTDMLLKLTIEIISEIKKEELSGNVLKLKELLKFDSTKLAKAKEISTQIKNRELSELTEIDIDIYEEFLEYISRYRDVLKNHFLPDDLGSLLQDFGDNARRCGNPIDFETGFKKEKAKTLFSLAEEANNVIKFYRNKKREEFGKTIYNEYVVEAFRNPYEIEYFRNRYYEFYLFSIFAPHSIRKNRPNYNDKRDNRDRGQSLKRYEFYKQNVSECVHLSDIAITNDSKKKFVLEKKLSKYFSLICRPGCIAPLSDELFMQQAYCMSVKSNCISRKVGAVIVDKRKYIVGAGWNDVGSGQIPCGMRRYSDLGNGDTPFPIALKSDQTAFAQFLKDSENEYSHHSFCFKDEYSRFKTSNKLKKLNKSDSKLENWKLKHKINKDAIDDLADVVVDHFSPKQLEYCRALHAEENALLQTAIIGGIGVAGATLYTTTFPCELCAKKIYQSRINKVIYTEPYPESISEDVFLKDGSHTVELVQFEGVKPYSYYRLFKSQVDKKEFQIQERLY